MSSFRSLLFALVVIVGGHAITIATAMAKDDAPTAKAHFSRGIRFYEVGDYQQALEEFKAAHLAKPDPAFLYNVAQCLRQLGQPDRALVMYKRYLAASPHGENRSDAVKRIAEIEETLTEEKRRTEPPTPALNEPASVAAENIPSPRLDPTTNGAMVGLSGAPVTPAAKAASSSSSNRGYLRWIGAGVTVALIGGAVTAGLSTSSKYDELRGSCGKTPGGCDDQATGPLKTRALITNILLAAAGISAIGTGILFYVTPQDAAVTVAWRL